MTLTHGQLTILSIAGRQQKKILEKVKLPITFGILCFARNLALILEAVT